MRIMKRTLLFTTLSLVLASPTLFAKSELETLRALCKEQERQIHQLEEDNSRLRSGDRDSHSPSAKAEVPAAVKTAGAPAPATTSPATYTVVAGDNFGKIARKVGTTPEKLVKANGLKMSAVIRPGQKLKVPGATAAAPQTVAQSTPSATPSAKSHEVKQGETFSSISKKHGISTAELIAANPAIKPTALRPGQVVSLVSSSAATTTISASTKAPEPRNSPAPAKKVPAAVPNNIPVSTPAAVSKSPAAPEPVAESTAPAAEKKVHPVTIDGEMTYGDFAAKHGTNTERLNALNGLDLTNATVLAKGSELYVPAQP